MALIENPHIESVRDTSVPLPLPAERFRAYDIRGIVDEQLSADSVRLISRGIASEALALGIDTLLVGYDGRLSSPVLSQALIEGLLSTGCNVINLGLIPTPLLYFATHTLAATSGVMLTASHNPANYNGLKIVFNRSCLADNQIQDIRKRIERNDLVTGSGQLSAVSIKNDYLENVNSRIKLHRNLRIIVDCGNAVPATVAPQLFKKIGCTVTQLFCDIDGSFPNHHPDPTVAGNLDTLARQVVESGADLGIAFDGDGDRLGLVTNLGEFIDADRLLMLLVEDILPKYPGAPIVFDVKCSAHLAALVTELGGIPVMHRSGHSFMKQKMQQTRAPLGGEYAAHIFIKDHWFGYDDGIYAAARIVEILSRLDASASEVFSRFKTSFTTPELKIPVAEAKKFELVQRLVDRASFPSARLIKIDGLRVEFEDGWGLVRASNTSPALLLRFEADTESRLEEIKAAFKALICGADKSLDVTL
jgi:phosphomannomutase / phosphoglucomutase